MEEIAFLILHYGEHKITEDCVDSIKKIETEMKKYIVVVDNDWNQPVEYRKQFSERYRNDENISFIMIKEKKGFSAANNIGYRFIKKNFSPNFIVVANNDIIFEQNDVANQLCRLYEENNFDVLAPDIIRQYDGVHQNPIAECERTILEVQYTIFMNQIMLWLFPIVYPIIRFFINRRKESAGNLEYHFSKKGIVPCGACIIFSKKFIKTESVIFEPETEFYYEEYILHHRCMIKGYEILYNPSVKVIHNDGMATKHRNKDEKKRVKFIMKKTLESAKIYKKELKKDRIRK